jgi:hypothetical protein
MGWKAKPGSDSATIPKEQKRLKDQEKIRVTVVDIKMPFSSMMLFMVKWAVVLIPAFTIL